MKKVLVFLLLIQAVFAQTFEMNGYKVDREIVKSAESKNDLSKLNYSVFNSNDELQTSFEIDWSYDLPFPQPGIFENGSIILVSSFEASVKFYNRFGQFEKEINLMKDAEPEYERSIHFDLKNDKMIFAISEPKVERAVVKIVERSGSTLNEFTSNYKNISGIKFSDDAEFIALSSYGWNNVGPIFESTILNKNLQTIFSIDQPFEFADFSDGSNYFFGFTNKNFFMVDVVNKQSVLTEKLNDGKIIIAAKFNEDEILVAASSSPRLENGEWIYQDATILKYNNDGNFVSETLIETDEFVNCQIDVKGSIPVLLIGSQKIELD